MAKNLTRMSSCAALESFRLIYKEEGLAGLCTGIGPRVGKVAPSCAIMMTSYEVIKRLFEKKTRSQPDLQPSANLSTHRQQSTWQ